MCFGGVHSVHGTAVVVTSNNGTGLASKSIQQAAINIWQRPVVNHMVTVV